MKRLKTLHKFQSLFDASLTFNRWHCHIFIEFWFIIKKLIQKHAEENQLNEEVVLDPVNKFQFCLLTNINFAALLANLVFLAKSVFLAIYSFH